MIVVVCPAAATTGGPEALHQLVDSLNRQGRDAAMLYLPGEYHHVPAPYAEYRVPTISETEVYPSDVVVVPEVMCHEVQRFAYARPVLWWLSVDNAPSSALKVNAMHVTQSRYAWEHLRSAGHQPLMLTDYIHRDFTEGFVSRRRAVAVNPVKGAEFISRFGEMHPDIELVPLEGKSRAEVAGILQTVSVFIDFGHQPGKDRLPREAAACGAVVFIRSAGAAVFRDDYPLPERFFFSAFNDLEVLGDRVREVLRDEASAYGEQGLYRRSIAREQSVFDQQALEFASRF